MSLFKEKTEASTCFNVKPSNEYLLSENYKNFCKIAYTAYEEKNYSFFEELSDDEITVLYISVYLHENYPLTAAYDDEVFEAIYNRENSAFLIDMANELIFNNLPPKSILVAFSQCFPNCSEGLTVQQKREKLIERAKQQNKD